MSIIREPISLSARNRQVPLAEEQEYQYRIIVRAAEVCVCVYV